MNAARKSGQLKVTLLKSTAGRLRVHRACARGLGLGKTHSSAVVADTAENRGMIEKISYLLRVEEVS
ncbi:MAG TPA: 50S ribosomal protein L30 [Gammaproteobacteria bacterium]|nr:50S ribosomal protein L30 [Gammaproteobacteria bacterium]